MTKLWRRTGDSGRETIAARIGYLATQLENLRREILVSAGVWFVVPKAKPPCSPLPRATRRKSPPSMEAESRDSNMAKKAPPPFLAAKKSAPKGGKKKATPKKGMKGMC